MLTSLVEEVQKHGYTRWMATTTPASTGPVGADKAKGSFPSYVNSASMAGFDSELQYAIALSQMKEVQEDVFSRR